MEPWPDSESTVARRSGRTYEDKLKRGELLDTQEQDQLIDDLRKQSTMLNKVWRLIMLVFGGVLIAFFTYSILCLILAGPTFLSFHRIFVPQMGQSTVLLLQLGSGLSALVTLVYAKGLPRPKEDLMTAAWVVAGAIAMFYILMMYLRDANEWINAWHPALPLVYVLITTYADWSAKKFENEIGSLEGLKYKYASL